MTSARKQLRGYMLAYLDIDVEAEYKRLETVGRIPLNRLRDRNTLLRSLNECQDHAHKAQRVALRAKRLRDEAMIDIVRRERELRRTAMLKVRAWLDKFKVRKQITDRMIEDELCGNDDMRRDWRKLVRQRAELDEIVGVTESLAKRWADRKFLLQSQGKLLEAEFTLRLGEGRKIDGKKEK